MQPKYLKTEGEVFKAMENGGKINYLSSNGEGIVWGTPTGTYATNTKNVRVRKDDGTRTIGSETGIGAFPIMTPGLTEQKSTSSYYKSLSA